MTKASTQIMMDLGHQRTGVMRGNQTDEYYERNAREYASTTLSIDMSALYARFLKYLPDAASILDAGAGAGRDTLAFLQRGYRVEAFDASPALCALSSQMTGMPTHLLRFQEVRWVKKFDGVWACASLLHVPKPELPDATGRLIRALKPGGAMYMSFKRGQGERIASDGRLFVDLEDEDIQILISHFAEARIVELWQSFGEGQLAKSKEGWINAIICKAA